MQQLFTLLHFFNLSMQHLCLGSWNVKYFLNGELENVT